MKYFDFFAFDREDDNKFSADLMVMPNRFFVRDSSSSDRIDLGVKSGLDFLINEFPGYDHVLRFKKTYYVKSQPVINVALNDDLSVNCKFNYHLYLDIDYKVYFYFFFDLSRNMTRDLFHTWFDELFSQSANVVLLLRPSRLEFMGVFRGFKLNKQVYCTLNLFHLEMENNYYLKLFNKMSLGH